MSNIFAESELPKPYMFVNREGTQTLKQKLEARTSLTQMEYINASLALINDSRAYEPRDRDHILRHIQDVTHDIMDRPWDVVRRWSQRVWDAVERRELSWGDSQLIQNLRVSIAITGCSKPGNQLVQAEHKGGRSETICRAFNSRNGCRHRSHHKEGGTRHLHVCSFCDAVGRHCLGHNVMGCNNKTQYPGPPHQPAYNLPQHVQMQGRGQAPEPNQWRPQYSSQNPSAQYPQFPKNGL